MPKNTFPRNGQLKPKKKVFKNNSRPQGRGNPNKKNNTKPRTPFTRSI